MARQPRLSLPGHPHHVIQRGHNRQAIVLDDRDRRRFLDELGHVCREHRLALHAYVLMDNHVHLLLTPDDGGATSRAMQSLGRRYVGWFNHRHGRTGGLWEGRFKAAVVDSERYLLACQRYIELNPVRAAMVPDAAAYRWSSARHHLGGTVDPLLEAHPLYWQLGNTPFERQAAYRQWLAGDDSDDDDARIERALKASRVIGSEAFTALISSEIERDLHMKRAGRPRRPGVEKSLSPILKSGAGLPREKESDPN